MSKAIRGKVIKRGVELLRTGTLPSVLPQKLMSEFELTQQVAKELGGAALSQWRAQMRPRGPTAGRK